MTTATVQSIESQIAELNAKKAELEAMSYEERKAEERKQREIKRIEDLTAYQKRVGYMVEQLVDADTGGLLNVKTTIDEETGVAVAEVTFTMNGRENTVDIEEHIVYGTGYRNNRSHGLKYRLSGSYNEYAKRMYKTAKSVLKKIAEHMEIAKAAELRDNAEQKQLNDGEQMLKSLYPDAKVERRVEWNRTYNTERTFFSVEGKHGTVNFRTYAKDGETVVVVENLTPNDTSRDEVADYLLLG